MAPSHRCIVAYVVRTSGESRGSQVRSIAPPYYPSCTICLAKMTASYINALHTTVHHGTSAGTRLNSSKRGTRHFVCSRCGAGCIESALNYRYKLELQLAVAAGTLQECPGKRAKFKLVRMPVFGDCIERWFGVSANELSMAIESEDPAYDCSNGSSFSNKLQEVSAALDSILAGTPLVVVLGRSLVWQDSERDAPAIRIDAAPQRGIVPMKILPLIPITVAVADMLPWLSDIRKTKTHSDAPERNGSTTNDPDAPPMSPQLTQDWDLDPALLAEMMRECQLDSQSVHDADADQDHESDTTASDPGQDLHSTYMFLPSKELLDLGHVDIHSDDDEIWLVDDDVPIDASQVDDIEYPSNIYNDVNSCLMDFEQLSLTLSQSALSQAYSSSVDTFDTAVATDPLTVSLSTQETAELETLLDGLNVDDFSDDMASAYDDDAFSDLDSIGELVELVERIELEHGFTTGQKNKNS